MARSKKPLTIQFKPKKSRLAQEFSEGLEFAFLSADNKQINQFVYCKDFMQDAIQGHVNKKKVTIYGFSYDPNKEETIPLCMEQTRILITSWRDKQFRTKVQNCLDFINQIEVKLKMKKTEITEVSNSPSIYKKAGIWLFEGSKRWMQSPPMISLYTLLIRIGFNHTPGTAYTETIQQVLDYKLATYRHEDAYYLKDAKKGLDWILKYGDRKLFDKDIKKNYPSVDIYTMHSNFGIVGFAQGYTKKYCPDWYKSLPQEEVPSTSSYNYW